MAFAPIGLKAVLDMESFNKSQKEYEKDLKSLDQQTQKTGSKLGGALRGIASVAGGMLAYQGIKTLVVGIKDMALAAQELPGVAAAFDGIGGSLERMREGSLGMVADVDLMKSYNSAAQLVSKDFADQLPDAMQYLAKVSAATGTTMDYMIDSMVKGVGRLSPMILDNLGIQVNLTEANEAYAKQLGKSASELTKSEQQTAVMNLTMQKLAQNTKDMPPVLGTAAQSLGVLKAQTQNVKLAFGAAALSVGNLFLAPLARLATKIGPKVVDMLNSFSKRVGQFQGMTAKAGSVLKAVGKVVASVADRIWSWVDSIIGLSDRVGQVLDPIREKLAPIGNALKFVRDNWDDLSDVVENFLTYVGTATDVFTPLKDTLEGIGLSSGAANQIAMIGDAVQQFIRTLEDGQGIVAAFQTGLFATGLVDESVVVAIGDIATKVQDAFSNLSSTFQAGGLSGIAGQLFAPLGLELPTAWQSILDEALPFLADTFMGLPQRLVEAFQTGGVGGVFSEAFAAAFDVVGTIGAIRIGIVDGLLQLGQDVLTTLGTAFPGIQPIIEDVFRPLLDIVTTLWNTFNEAKATIVSAIMEMFSNPQETVGSFKDILAQVVPVVQSVILTLTEVAANVIPVFMEVVAAIVPIVSTAIEIISQIAADVLPVLGEAFVAVSAVVAEVMPDILAIVSDVLDVIQLAWTAIWPVLQTALEGFLNVALPLFQGLVDVIAGVVSTIKSLLEGDLVGAWNSLKDTIVTIGATLITAVTNLFQGIIDVIKSIFGIGSPSTVMVDIATDFLNGFVGGILGMTEAVFQSITDLLVGMSDLFLEYIPEWTQIGVDLINGLLGGLLSKVQEVKDAAVGVVSDAVGAVKNFLGIGSPSKLFWAVSEDIVAGIAGPLEQGAPTVDNALAPIMNTFDAMVNWLKDFGTSLRGANLQDQAEIFEDMGDGFDSLTKAMKNFIIVGRELAVGDITDTALMQWLETWKHFVVVMADMATGLEAELGYNRIKEARHTIKRMSDIIQSMMIDLNFVKKQPIVDIQAYVAQIGELGRGFYWMLYRMRKDFGEDALAYANSVAQSVGGILSIVKGALDALNALAEWTPVQDLTEKATAMAERIGQFVTAMADMAGSLGFGVAAAVQVLTNAKTILEFGSAGIDVLKALVEYKEGEGLPEKIARVRADLQIVITELQTIASGLEQEAVEAAADILKSAQAMLGFVEPGIDALKALAEYETAEDLLERIGNFSLDMYDLIDELIFLAGRFEAEAVKAAVEFAEAAAKVVGFVRPGVDALTALADYKSANLLLDRIGSFSLDMFDLIDELVFLAGRFEAEGVKAAGELFSSVSSMVGFIQPALEALKALGDYKTAKLLLDRIGSFSLDMFDLIDELVFLAGRFELEGVQAAAAFGEAVTRLVGFVRPAVDALAAIADYAPLQGLRARMQTFAGQLAVVVNQIRLLASYYKGAGLGWAVEWAGYVSSMVGVIKPAIDAIAALVEYKPASGLLAQMQVLMGNLAPIVNQIRLLAAYYKDAGLGAAAEWASNVSSMVGVIKPGIDAIAALKDFVPQAGLGPIMVRFREQLAIVVEQIRLMAEDFKETGVTWAATFATHAQAMIGLIQPGIEAINSIVKYAPAGTLPAKVHSLRLDLNTVLEEVVDLAKEWHSKGLKAADKFADTALKLVGLVQPSIDALVEIVDYKSVAKLPRAVRGWRDDMESFLDAMVYLARAFASEMSTILEFFRNVDTLHQAFVSIDAWLVNLTEMMISWEQPMSQAAAAMRQIEDYAQTMFQSARSMYNWLAGIYTGGLEGLPDGVSGWADAFSQAILAMWNWYQNEGKAKWDAMLTEMAVKTVWVISGRASSGAPGIVGIRTAFEDMLKDIDSFIVGPGTGGGLYWNKLMSAMAEAIGPVRDAAATIASSINETGTSVVDLQGLWSSAFWNMYNDITTIVPGVGESPESKPLPRVLSYLNSIIATLGELATAGPRPFDLIKLSVDALNLSLDSLRQRFWPSSWRLGMQTFSVLRRRPDLRLLQHLGSQPMALRLP